MVEENDPAWSAWPLPYTAGDNLADVGVYARDVCKFAKFAKKFSQVAGLQRQGPRSLPQGAQAPQLWSLEDRSGEFVAHGFSLCHKVAF